MVFPAPFGPDDAGDLTLFDVEVDAREDLQGPEALSHPAQFKNGHGLGSLSSVRRSFGRAP